ncbi:MAG: hypothetical protein ACJ72N_26235 [Labedaea sp.]
MIMVLVPGVASAGAIVQCPSGITEWKLISGRTGVDTVQFSPDGQGCCHFNVWEGHRYTLVSAVPQFLVSDGRALDNGTDIPVTFTVSSSVSRTFSISATVGITATLVKDFLTSTVSTSIQASVTTAVGVTVSTTVPAHTRLIAEYGTNGYQVSYYIEAWRWKGPFGGQPPAAGTAGCEEWGYYPQNTQAPTNLETWRLRSG